MSILDRLKDGKDLKAKKTQKAPPGQQFPAATELQKQEVRLGSQATEIEEAPKEEPNEEYDSLRLMTPRTIEDLGVRREFLMPHVLKTVCVLDIFTVNEAAERLCLPVKITNDLLDAWKDLKSIEVTSASGYHAASRRYAMTTEGRRRAQEYTRLSAYVGPVPVPISNYREMVKHQTVLETKVNSKGLKKTLSQLVVSEKLFKSLGPAVNSGQTIFLYGPPGNGKTAIAIALSSLLDGLIAIPKAIELDGFVMRLYDPSIHRAEGDQPEDTRWLMCKRPIVVVGGELTIEMMDLRMDPNSNTYEAPPHVKSNNGVFILDDFGRQLVRPRDLLNRWIVPLEKRVDFLSLHTGNKVELPFDQLVIFSTNINPKELLDEAFMRRLHHKVFIGPLELDGFREAFKMTCIRKKVPFNAEVFDALIKDVYEPKELPFNGCHPRDLLDHLIHLAKYEEKKPEMTKDLLMRACENYFVQIDHDNRESFTPSAGGADLLK